MQLDGYTLTAPLHASADVSIWRATRDADGASVVVKSATRGAAAPHAVASRLRHEARALERLRDVPGVVRLIEAREDARGLSLVFVDDGLAPLGARVAAGALPLVVALRVARGLAEALGALHRRDVVHRDIKPDNVLSSDDGARVALIDFGVASLRGDAPAGDAVEGTLAYVAPEQTGRTGRAVDARADLYALGVTLFEMLSGARPFTATDPRALVHAHLAVAPPALDAVAAVPTAVARVVARLLEKAPEARYQTAAGLRADLTRCLDQLAARGEVAPFALGRDDFSARIALPQALVGRDAERATLAAALARAASGGRELVLLVGPSGSGKTALARTVEAAVARDGRGVFLAGKHERLARTRPYAGLAAAFGALCARHATASSADLARTGARLRETLGANARRLADVMPELLWVTGPLDPVDELGPQEQQNRLALAWRSLAERARDDADGPLALFIDDAQWADQASLALLGGIASELDGTLLLVSVRGDEVDAAHPLWDAVARARSRGANVTRIEVTDLDATGVEAFLAAALHGAEDLGGLASLVWRRTHGNPFFVGQMLLALGAHELVTRSAATGQWRWDLDAVARAPLGDGVVALVAARLGELPEETRRALGVAACEGARFDLRALAESLDAEETLVAQSLWPAVQIGMVVAEEGRYRFIHDRVQLAAYERLDPAARAATHRALGRRLGARGTSGAARFERARHLLAGLSAEPDPAARVEVARACMEAAGAARAAGAFEEMGRLATGADDALAGLDVDPALRLAVASLRVEGDVLLRRFDEAEARASRLLAGDLPRAARLGLHVLRLRVAVTTGALARGIAVAQEALAELGVVAPEGAAMLPALQGLVGRSLAVDPALFEGDPRAWLAGEGDASDALFEMLVLQGGLCAAIGGAPLLGGYWTCVAVDRILTARRVTPASPMMLVAFGQILSTISTDYLLAARWVRLGADLADRMRSPVQADCAVQDSHLTPHRDTVDRTVAAYERAVALGFEQGAFQAISWGTTGALVYGYAWRGEPVPRLRERVARCAEVVARAGDTAGQDIVDFMGAWLDALALGPRAAPREAEDFLAVGPRAITLRGNANGAAIARVYECHARYVYGHHRAALAMAEEAERERASMFALVTVTDIDLWLGLAAARVHDVCDTSERAAHRAHVARAAERFAGYARGSADNFEHKRLLLAGELARVDGRPLDALARFEAAAEAAERAGFVFVQGLAWTRAGDVAAGAGMRHAARAYWESARDLYAALGADALAEGLTRAHDLRGATAPVADGVSRTTHLRASDLDVETVRHAAQALAEERDPRGVVGRLMSLVVESAGAERGALLLARDGAWELSARLEGSSVVEAPASVDLDAVEGVATAAVRYVARTRERVVTPDAAKDPRFAGDARIASGATVSVVAAPLLHRGELVGVLYLEHRAAGAFPPARVALLEMLAGLGAVAYENARLFAGLREAGEALREANAGLERQVAARTAALDRALADLWSEMDLATKIQTALLPEGGRRGGYDLAAVMRPAERVGGDYYDVFEHGGRVWALVGDVSGHGVNAGLVMMMVQTAVRAVVRALDARDVALSPARLLAVVNAAVRPNLARIGRGQYMTLTAMRLDAEGIVHAGLHQDLLVRRAATGAVEQLPSKGFWLGIVDDLTPMLVDTPLALAPGDSVVLYTDGVTESRAGEDLLGHDPMVEAVARAGDAPPAAVVDALLALLPGRVVDDDVTVMCLRRA